MDPAQMQRLFQTHRDAERRRDFDDIMKTFTENCYLETIALGQPKRRSDRGTCRVRRLLQRVPRPDAR